MDAARFINTPRNEALRSLAEAIESSRQRFRAAEASKLVPVALGACCPCCKGFRFVETHTVLGQAPRLQPCLACS